MLASLEGHPRVTFGSTVSGRPADLAGQDRIVGNLINTVPIVADTRLPGSLTVWLRQLQAAIFTSARHGHVPYRDILTAAGIKPGTTLFDSIVVFMNYPRVGELDTALQVVRSSYDEHSHYPLAVLALPGDELELIVIHDDELIAAERADELLKLLDERLTSMPAAMAEPAARYFENERLSPSSLARIPLRVEPLTVTAYFWRALHAHRFETGASPWRLGASLRRALRAGQAARGSHGRGRRETRRSRRDSDAAQRRRRRRDLGGALARRHLRAHCQ